MLTERRRFPRFPFHAVATLEIGAARHPATLIDISLGGALIRPTQPISSTTAAVCCLELANGNTRVCRIASARIASPRQDLIGIAFASLDGDTQHFLATLVEMNLGVKTLLERDFPAMLDGTHGR
ncbi:MAG: PilZ domain-containing protein [Azonexus sp.]|jgi:hypothetical protein|nr:PilZ domain-containing protein [Azonexus sp.]